MKKDEVGNKEKHRDEQTPDDGYYLDSDYDEDDAGLSEGESWDEDWEASPGGRERPGQKRAWQEQEEARAAEEEKARAREEILRRATEAVAKAEAVMKGTDVPGTADPDIRRFRALERAREEGRKRAQAVGNSDELARMKEDWVEPIRKEEKEDWLDAIRREEEAVRQKAEQARERQMQENLEIDDEEGTDPYEEDSYGEMNDKEKQSTQAKKSGGKGGKIAGGIAAAVLVAGGAAYIVMAQQYKKEFFPNTQINGLEAGRKEIDQVKEMISSAMDGYQIRLVGRKGQDAVLTKDDVGLHTVFDGTLEEILEDQNPYLWGIHLIKKEDLQVSAVAAYDETAFQEKVENLAFLDPQNVQSGKEAYISEYIEGTGYEIVPEDPGTEIKKDVLMEKLGEAMLTMQSEFSLEDAGCYLKPLPGEPDPDLVAQKDMLNRFAQMSVTYTFGDEQEVLNGDLIHKWVSFDEENQPVVDEEQVKEFVEGLAKKYDTANTVRKFTTTYGSEVEVSGAFGWKIDQKAETEALMKIVAEGESMVREPEYAQEGITRSGQEYGDTYAEVNLTAQHLFLYKDGEKVLESDFVSGNVARGHATPAGIYSIAYKQKNAVLRGPGYASPVNFWMPFNGGIGFHDASWRGSFGGSIYRTNGSHGCVNMPYNAAKTMFENVYAGMPVICYNLDGTSNTKSTNASGGTAPRTAAQPAVPAVPVAPVVPAAVPQPAVTPVLGNEGGGSMGGGSVVVPEAMPETPAVSELPGTSGVGDGSAQGSVEAGGQEALPAQPSAPAQTPAPDPAQISAPAPIETPAPAPIEPPAPAPAPAPDPAVMGGSGSIVPEVPAVPGM